MSATRIVIVGGVAGGMSAATRMRRLDESASITVIERSGHVSYANCGLPYFVGGVIEDENALLLQTHATPCEDESSGFAAVLQQDCSAQPSRTQMRCASQGDYSGSSAATTMQHG